MCLPLTAHIITLWPRLSFLLCVCLSIPTLFCFLLANVYLLCVSGALRIGFSTLSVCCALHLICCALQQQGKRASINHLSSFHVGCKWVPCCVAKSPGCTLLCRLPSYRCCLRHVSSMCVVDLWNEHHIDLPSPPAFLFQRRVVR